MGIKKLRIQHNATFHSMRHKSQNLNQNMNTTVYGKVISAQFTMSVHSLATEDRRSTALFKYTLTFLFQYCSIRTGSCQSSFASNSGIFLFSAFSRIRRYRSKATRSLYLIKLRTFSLGRMTAKNEVDAFVRDSQNASSFDSASLCSCCNCLISFWSSDIFSFSSGCLPFKPQASWD